MYGPWYVCRREETHNLLMLYGVGQLTVAHRSRLGTSHLTMMQRRDYPLYDDDAYFVVNTDTERPLVIVQTVSEVLPFQAPLLRPDSTARYGEN